MWTHLNGRKIIVAYYLQVKLLGYQGYSILTLLSTEEGKMFTNSTEPGNSQSRRKGKGTGGGEGVVKGRGVGRKRAREKKVAEGGTDKILGNTKLFRLQVHLILYILNRRFCSTKFSASSPILRLKKILDFNNSIKTKVYLTNWIKPWRQY